MEVVPVWTWSGAAPATATRYPRRAVHFGPESPPVREDDEQPLQEMNSGGSRDGRKSTEQQGLARRSTDKPADRPQADVYYDSQSCDKARVQETRKHASGLLQGTSTTATTATLHIQAWLAKVEAFRADLPDIR